MKSAIVFYKEMLEYVDMLHMTPAEVGEVMVRWWRYLESGEEWDSADRTLKLMFEMLCRQNRRLNTASKKNRKEMPEAIPAAETARKSGDEAAVVTPEEKDTQACAEETAEEDIFYPCEKRPFSHEKPDTLRNGTYRYDTLRSEAEQNDTQQLTQARAGESAPCISAGNDADRESEQTAGAFTCPGGAAAGLPQEYSRIGFDTSGGESEAVIAEVRRSMVLPAHAAERLARYCERLSAPVVRYALNEALSGGGAKWRYLSAILERYENEGMTDIERVQRDARTFRERNTLSGGRRPPNSEYQHHEYTEADFEDIYLKI